MNAPGTAVSRAFIGSTVGKVAIMSKTPASPGPTTGSATSVEALLPAGSTVRLDVPLHAGYASTLRVVLASLASDLGFTVDDIDDLRLAVSEVFSTLVQQGEPTKSATFSLTTSVNGAHSLAVSVGFPDGSAALDLDPLALAIIGAAVDEFNTASDGVTLVKVSASSQPAT